ncbi:PREDICTED: uncharacterized protein LOC107171736, partial [Diuraphis noxia]|uniref:uncharacterized protein LOC107171736 n=1 Tax=Diuraphis noxia TaxID=143948 RepID=UPI000763B262
MNDPNQYAQAVQNQGYLISGPRNSRHHVNSATHNVSDMKNNHMTNMGHSPIQIVPTQISQRQQTLYLQSNVAYQGTSNPAYYQFPPQQASQTALLMPYVNYSSASQQ